VVFFLIDETVVFLISYNKRFETMIFLLNFDDGTHLFGPALTTTIARHLARRLHAIRLEGRAAARPPARARAGAGGSRISNA